jgi:hypothetical protein
MTYLNSSDGTYHNPHKLVAQEIKAGTYGYSAGVPSPTVKAQLMEILRQLPSRKHAMVFVDALESAKENLQNEDIQNPTCKDVMVKVVGVLENWIESNNYRYADPTDNHKKGKLDDVIGETCNFFKSLGFYY